MDKVPAVDAVYLGIVDGEAVLGKGFGDEGVAVGQPVAGAYAHPNLGLGDGGFLGKGMGEPAGIEIGFAVGFEGLEEGELVGHLAVLGEGFGGFLEEVDGGGEEQDAGEAVRVHKAQAQGAVAAHGEAADEGVGAVGGNGEQMTDGVDELVGDVVAVVANGAAHRAHLLPPAVVAGGHDHGEVAFGGEAGDAGIVDPAVDVALEAVEQNQEVIPRSKGRTMRQGTSRWRVLE